MHKSRDADATAGPEGAYSLESWEEEKYFAMNPDIPFCCWFCWFCCCCEVVVVVLEVVVLEDVVRRGESGRVVESALLDMDRRKRNRWDRQAMCRHKLVFPAVGVLLLLLLLVWSLLLRLVAWLLLLLSISTKELVGLLFESSCASILISKLLLLLLDNDVSGTISISFSSSKLDDLLILVVEDNMCCCCCCSSFDLSGSIAIVPPSPLFNFNPFPNPFPLIPLSPLFTLPLLLFVVL